MDWLRDLQASLRAPVFAFLSQSWPYLALMAVGGFIYFLVDGARTARRERADAARAGGGVSFGSHGPLSGDADAGDGGGDGGGD